MALIGAAKAAEPEIAPMDAAPEPVRRGWKTTEN